MRQAIVQQSWILPARALSNRMVALVLAVTASTISVHAVQPDEVLKDPALEGRARALSRDLRCMVCPSQSIDDSDADLARDVRILVRERLMKGDTDEQVVDFLSSRFGEYVLLKPRFTLHNAPLWITPAVVLLAGAAAMAMALRRRRTSAAATPPLSEDEERRLAEVIGREP